MQKPAQHLRWILAVAAVLWLLVIGINGTAFYVIAAPENQRILQNMAIAYSKTGRLDEAVRCYRRALEIDPELSGAHYGLAFLLLKRGDHAGAEQHLDAFLANPPRNGEAERWVRHARQTLEQLRAGENADSVPEPE